MANFIVYSNEIFVYARGMRRAKEGLVKYLLFCSDFRKGGRINVGPV